MLCVHVIDGGRRKRRLREGGRERSVWDTIQWIGCCAVIERVGKYVCKLRGLAQVGLRQALWSHTRTLWPWWTGSRSQWGFVNTQSIQIQSSPSLSLHKMSINSWADAPHTYWRRFFLFFFFVVEYLIKQFVLRVSHWIEDGHCARRICPD